MDTIGLLIDCVSSQCMNVDLSAKVFVVGVGRLLFYTTKTDRGHGLAEPLLPEYMQYDCFKMKEFRFR